MAQEQQRGSVYDVITIKHEPVEHDPVETPEHEVEHVFLKKEALVRSHKLQVRRISVEQRTLMLDFMMKYPTLATGRFTEPDGARLKQQLLKELTTKLNSLPNGALKSEDKWMKSWQDWKSDVKSKAFVSKKEMQKTGGGLNTKAKPLTPLEERLLNFLRPRVVSGHEEIPDRLTVACQNSGQVTQNDSDEKDSMVLGEYVVLPLEEPTTMSVPDISPGHISPALTSPPRASSEESVPSTSGFAPASHETEFSCASPSPKKRKHCVSDTSAKDDDPLVDITRDLLTCLQEQNTIRRAQLHLDERKTVAIENASVAFAGAMKALEEYLKHRRDNE